MSGMEMWTETTEMESPLRGMIVCEMVCYSRHDVSQKSTCSKRWSCRHVHPHPGLQQQKSSWHASRSVRVVHRRISRAFAIHQSPQMHHHFHSFHRDWPDPNPVESC